MIVQVADGPMREIGPGSYIFFPGGTPHTAVANRKLHGSFSSSKRERGIAFRTFVPIQEIACLSALKISHYANNFVG